MESETVGEQMTDLAGRGVKPMSGPEAKTFWSKDFKHNHVIHVNKFLYMNEQIPLCVH